MSRGGLVIGLGGTGLRVAARVRQVLASGAQARLPESIRLLAFDIHKPAPATGRLPQSYYFLVQLPPAEAAAPGKPARLAARAALLADLAQGAVSSLTLRGLAAQLDALRRAGVTQLETFLVCASFGSTGSAWLVDFAYLVRHLSGDRMRVRVHAVLVTPEAFERSFFPTQAHQLTNFVVFKELESLQRERNWESGISLYGGKYIGSLPGLLKRAPFDSVQVIDAQELGVAPEMGAIPAAADGILCQIDTQAGAVLEEAAQFSKPVGNQVFSSFGVFSLVYPTRLMMEQAVQRLVIGSIDQYIPLEKNPDTDRPLRLAEPVSLRPDDPYGKLEVWIADPHHSGVLQEVLREAGPGGAEPAARKAFAGEMAGRSLEQWKAFFYQCEGAESYLPQGDLLPEPMDPLVSCHVRVFLRALAQRIARPDPRLGAPLEYLQKLEQALSAYLQDLDAAVEAWREKGETSENDTLVRSLGEARKDWETRRTSLLGRLMPNAAQDAQERYFQARQAQAHYKQRETIVGGIVQAASTMRVATHLLLELGQRLLRALALLPDSAYNVALDQSQRLEREMRFESAVRSQQLVVDRGYETRQSRLVFDEFSARLANQVMGSLTGLAQSLDWEARDQRLPFQVNDPNLEGESVALDDPEMPNEQLAALLTRVLSYYFAGALLSVQPDNSVLNFLSYLDPRADRLAGRLVGGAAPALRLLTPVKARRSFLFSPQANSQSGSAYSQTLLGELQLHIGDVYVFHTDDPDRLTLFRFYDGLSLDNLLTIHNSEPRTIDPAQLRPYVLWNL